MTLINRWLLEIYAWIALMRMRGADATMDTEDKPIIQGKPVFVILFLVSGLSFA